ncbi:sodium:solute symporter family protein [Flagellimonas onchidii]|uniref:sodium:solute symporter family protein n=1 Tax=Flagellimonas onchidii TaxID=2562684 RepID=UPI0010A6A78C|nr:hypothetical protein [Allomuricauda onchidii]
MDTGVGIALGIYFAILIVLTFLAKSNTASDFLRASNSIGWRGMSISLFASLFSSYNLVVGLTFTYLFGPWVLLVYIGAFMAFYVIYVLIKKQREKGVNDTKFNSIIDYANIEFGLKNAKTLNVSLAIILFIFISLQFFVNSTIFSELIGWNKYISTISVGVIVLIYTFIAGLKVEIYTDIFQGILMFLFLGLAMYVDFSSITISSISPKLFDTNIILGAVSFAIAQFLTILVQPEMWQRYYAVKNTKEIKKGIFVSYGLITVFIVPIILIGLSAFVNGGVDNPQTLFYDILRQTSPKGFLPFISVAMFAAFMSSIDSSLFAVSSQISKFGLLTTRSDEFHENDEQKEVNRTRITMIIISIIAVLTALYLSNFLTYVIQLVSLTTVISVVLIYSKLFKLSKEHIFLAFIFAILSFVASAYSGIINDKPESVLFPSLFTFGFLVLSNIFISFRKSRT